MAVQAEDSEPIAIYATFPDMETAEAAGGAVVAAGLAACVNLIPGMRSIYRWQGKLERAEEVVAIIKTVGAREDEVIAVILAGHPHTTPAVVTLPLVGGSQPYLDWINAETRR